MSTATINEPLKKQPPLPFPAPPGEAPAERSTAPAWRPDPPTEAQRAEARRWLAADERWQRRRRRWWWRRKSRWRCWSNPEWRRVVGRRLALPRVWRVLHWRGWTFFSS